MHRAFSAADPEWMDRDDVPPAALREQLRRLEQINRWFGGHAAMRTVAERLFAGRKRVRIADLATGFADQPRFLADWVARRGIEAKVFAVDRHAATLRLARAATPAHLPIFFVQADVARLPFKDGAVDAALCSLALHHFSEEDAITVLREQRRIARHGAALVDLTRGWLAYAATWLLTALWMRDAQTRHDGRLSVRNAFTPAELRRLAAEAGWRGTWRRLPWFRQAVIVRDDSAQSAS
jgi:ubiquinone/menaquinone biosynthesis C-methylase UbiE